MQIEAAATICGLWAMAMGPWIISVLQTVAHLCVVYNSLVYADRLLVMGLRGFIKLAGRTPETIYNCQPLKGKDSSTFPMVLVQIPMYNEKEVYRRSIGAVCEFSWPTDRLIVQVLDDSDDVGIKELVQRECEMWREKGINVKYENRPSRDGYKAGNLSHGLKQSYAEKCEFVAVFDADFEPQPDFLERTIPYLVHNSELGFVMGSWVYRNAGSTILSYLQEISFSNFGVLFNPVASSLFGFAIFFGSGGVWRMTTILDSGGWRSRVLVEDLDLSLCAALRGWKSVYLEDLKVKAEVPNEYTAFRTQITRLSNGVANLSKIHMLDIAKSKALSFRAKYFILVSLFNFCMHEHFSQFFYSCILVPLVLLFPEIQVPRILLVAPFFIYNLHVLTIIPRYFHLSLFWILFENVRAMIRVRSATAAFFGASTKWVVTKRVAAEQSPKQAGTVQQIIKDSRPKDVFFMELFVGVFLVTCASMSTWSGYWPWRILLYLQALSYFSCALGIGFL